MSWWNTVRIEDLGAPQEPEPPIRARAEVVEPSEGQVRREIDALRTHRLETEFHTGELPQSRDRSSGSLVTMICRVPQDHLFQAHVGEPAALAARHVIRAAELDHLDGDRAQQPGDEPVRAARVVDRRRLAGGHLAIFSCNPSSTRVACAESSRPRASRRRGTSRRSSRPGARWPRGARRGGCRESRSAPARGRQARRRCRWSSRRRR